MSKKIAEEKEERNKASRGKKGREKERKKERKKVSKKERKKKENNQYFKASIKMSRIFFLIFAECCIYGVYPTYEINFLTSDSWKKYLHTKLISIKITK